MTIIAPVPSAEPAALMRVVVHRAASIISSAGTTGTDEPPGITAFSLRPPRTPPAISSSSGNGMPSGSSKLPGFSTWPDTEKIIVPPESFDAEIGEPLRALAQDRRDRGDSSACC